MRDPKTCISPLTLMMCLLPAVAVTCNPAPLKGGWSEFRIDRAGEVELFDSRDSRMCVSENGNVYVIWIDDRNVEGVEGVPNIWLNRKLANDERDQGWLPSAVRVNRFLESQVAFPDIACTDFGVYVVWQDDRDGEVESQQIYFQRSTDNGETWLPADVLLEEDEDGRSDSYNPNIVADGANVYVAWSDNLNGAFDILFARSTDSGNTFQSPLRVDSDQPAGGAFSAFPQIATGFGGQNVYVVWEDFRNGGATPDGGSDVYFARSIDSGQSFQSDQRLDVGDEPGSANSFVPKIAADDDDIYVVWHDDRFGEFNDAMMTYSGDGGVTWTSSSPADQADNRGFNQSLYPQVCMDGGRGHVVWHDNREQGFYRAYYNQANDGVWRGQEIRLDENKPQGTRASRTMAIACDGDNVLASWLDETHDERDVGFNDIAYNFSADGGDTWLEADKAPEDRDTYRLDSVTEGTAFKKDVAISIKGNLVKAAWTDGRAGSTDIYYQQLIAGEVPVVTIQTE